MLEAIVDTCFFEKVSSNGKNPDNVKRVLNEMGYSPIVHPYVSQHELSLKSYAKEFIDSGYVREIQYPEFIPDEFAKQLYENQFSNLHEEMRKSLEAKGGKKQIDKLTIPAGQDIYSYHKQGSSMGDVHMILMAAFMKKTLILTQDSDIELLKSIASRKMSFGSFKLEIVNALDVVMEIAQKKDCNLSKKDLEQMLNEMGERSHRSEMTAVWKAHHTAL